MPYNSDPRVLTLAEILDPITGSAELRAVAVSKYFEVASRQYNALEHFTSVVDRNSMSGGGIRSIIAKKNDLSKGGGQVVHFGTISVPAGPGVQGDSELTGNTSKSNFGSYPCVVDWVRDGVEWTKDDVAHIAAGGTLEQVTVDLLSEKMGITKQNQQLKRFIDGALTINGKLGTDQVEGVNIYRPNNRTSVDALTTDDDLGLEVLSAAKARLSTMGGRPLMRNTSKSGSPVNGYLLFTTTTGMLPIRNDTYFQGMIAQGDTRGDENGNFSGALLNWQGQSLYELQVTDQDWDDYIGNPMVAKAIVSVAVEPLASAENLKLIVNPLNTKNQYFQWFGGKSFRYNRIEPLILDDRTYYIWAINPDGSRVFASYAAAANNGNQITLTAILSPAVGSSGLDSLTVGQLNLGTGATVSSNIITPVTTVGSLATLPTTGTSGAWVYSNKIQAGAVIIQANARGVPYSRSFVFASMAGCVATGSIDMSPIQQVRDFGFIQGRGFEMIYGTCVTKNAKKQTNGYLLIEHAIQHEGFPVPSFQTAA